VASVPGARESCDRLIASRRIDEQKLPAVRDRGWRIRRRDLEQL
jgi:hypothetical protein